MFLTKMVTFCKNANCPSSQELLAFQNEEASTETGILIHEHIKMCEFCEAEIEFYAHYPQSEEKVTSEEIPLPLYELAEALLNKGCGDFSALNKLLDENQRFELKKA